MSRDGTIAAMLLALAVGAVSLPSCAGRPGGRAAGAQDESYPVDRTFEKGPVKVRVRLSAESLTIADTLTLLVEAHGSRDCRLRLPGGEDLHVEPFSIRDLEKEGPRLTADASLASERVVLEPFLSGDYTIGPFKVGFMIEGEEPNEDGSERVHEVRVEEMKVHVDSLTGQEAAALDLRPLRGPVSLAAPRGGPPLVWVVAAGLALAAAGGSLAFVLVRRTRAARGNALAPPAPREAALEALRRLRDRRLLAQGRVREFYFEICLIVRTFIEGQFGIHAPEETTQEFLRELAREERFSGETKGLLGRFLEHCDLVKFARYAPREGEIQETIDVTRRFIEAGASAEPAGGGTRHGV